MGLVRLSQLPLRLRLVLWFAVVLLSSIAAVEFFLITTIEGSLQQEIDEALRLRASGVARELAASAGERLDAGDVGGELLELTPEEEFAAPGIYIRIHDLEGNVIAVSPNLRGGELPATPELLSGGLAGREAYETVHAEAERVRVLTLPVVSGEETIGVIVVGESLHVVDATLRRMRQQLLLAATGAPLAALVGGWWITQRALGPIAEVIRVGRGISSTGRFDQRIDEPAAHDELRELVTTFNEMLAAIERSVVRQQEFLADVSHELRGPLMIIRGNLDLLALGLPQKERREAAREATEEVERMAHLVSDLLLLVEIEGGEVAEHRPTRLDEVVAEVWERAQRLNSGSHSLILGGNEAVSVRGDRDRLTELVWNLIENALRYTPTGGCVTVALRLQGKLAELTVADTGIGIPPEHLPRIFDRFYRVDRARSRAQGGSGLGLAIVRQVADDHSGDVRVSSRPGMGSSFTVVLPTES
ncbi:MAG: HAMP domain-containing protein [Chloroflexi bacterium]|nr:HAMP domain-containing protein [Chloroflexota bacterium]